MLTLGMYYGVGHMVGASGAVDFSRTLVASQLRGGATDLVAELLPKPSWHRENLMSWVRFCATFAGLYVFFVWLLESRTDIIIKNTAGDILYHSLDTAFSLLHFEKWQAFFPKLAFVYYWKRGYGSTVAYITFGLMFADELLGYLGTEAAKRVSKPYSIVLPWAFKLPSVILFKSSSLLFEKWTPKRLQKLHRDERVVFMRDFWGISAEKSYYQILGVPETAKDRDIKKAFREHSRKLHPDKNPDPKAQELFIQIKEAYNNLLKQGSREDMRMKQLEANEKTLKEIMDILVIGMPYLFSFLVFSLGVAGKLFVYFATERRKSWRKQAKENYLQEEWDAFLESQTLLELYVRSGRNGPVKESATKWLHPLKRAIAYKARTSFKGGELKEEDLKQQLADVKRKVLGGRKAKTESAEEEARNITSKIEMIEERAKKLISFGLVHRLLHLYQKKVFATMFLEEYVKKGDFVLEKEMKELDEAVTRATGETDEFGEIVDEAYDLSSLLLREEGLLGLKNAMRFWLRKELRMKGEKRLQWMRETLVAPWYEFPLHKWNKTVSQQ